MSFSVTARSPLEKTRYETSLGLLTKKFVSLFHSSSSGTVDLNKVMNVTIVVITNCCFHLNQLSSGTVNS